jgi:hypothetical protein
MYRGRMNKDIRTNHPDDIAVFVTLIKREIEACRAEAMKEGFDPETEWEPTEADAEFVIEELGRKPTRQEWADAGWKYVGGKHVGEAS